MERIIKWFVDNIVAANMLMIFIIIAGIMAIPFLRMEVFPEIEVEIINVSALYPGASPSARRERGPARPPLRTPRTSSGRAGGCARAPPSPWPPRLPTQR